MALAGSHGGHEQRFIQEAFDTNWVVPLGPNGMVREGPGGVLGRISICGLGSGSGDSPGVDSTGRGAGRRGDLPELHV